MGRASADLTARDVGVVIPIRSFELGKARLADELDAPARVALARALAQTVLLAAGSRPVVVVSSAPDVLDWARARGVTVLADPGSLDGAARAGVEWFAERGAARAVVAHGDLPLASSLDPVCSDASRPIAVIVPCHRDDGTTVLAVPTGGSFAFSYGPGSFRRHVAAAHAAGLAVRVVRDPELAFDLDVPEDLAQLATPARGAA